LNDPPSLAPPCRLGGPSLEGDRPIPPTNPSVKTKLRLFSPLLPPGRRSW